MSALAKPLRTQLENTVKSARDIAETAARAALQQLAVGEGRLPDYLNDAQRALRRRLRAHGRSLGDAKHGDDTQELRRLVWEVAYEHWHRMLFARFLAENGLLLWEPGAAVSLQDCREMVDHHPEMAMGARSEWELAGKLAARMLPQVFKPQHPVFELVFAPEHQRELERLLAALPPEVFQASDSLGWVYQFWQARRKDEVNASEVKIGADELPAVTQLFTEPYMVDFLLHNSLGAWWLTRHPATPCPVPLTYLRRLEDGTPAAGRFEGWPDTLADFKLLDPCCGSGHFLVAAFLMLVPMRIVAEHLSAREAVDAVLRDNLHGLELDPRCVEIAVFALALAAWRFPDETGQPLGVRADMPAPNIACCGLKVAARAADWMALVPDEVPNAAYLRQELRLLHDSFSQAPLLGSLLDPARSLKSDLATPSFATLRALLERALSTERPATLWGEGNEVQDEAWDHALTARGLLDAARLLDARYHLVVTNVPYLARINQSADIKAFCDMHYADAVQDLANVFLERCLELTCAKFGVVQCVLPVNWLFLAKYEDHRRKLLLEHTWLMLAKLGPKAFETISGEVVKVALLSIREERQLQEQEFLAIEASSSETPALKARVLAEGQLIGLTQRAQLGNADSRVLLESPNSDHPTIESLGSINPGISPGDTAYVRFGFWEVVTRDSSGWHFMQSAPEFDSDNGASFICRDWEEFHLDKLSGFRLRGKGAWRRPGVLVSKMGVIQARPYLGRLFDANCAVISPFNGALSSALLAFCRSDEYLRELKKIDEKKDVAIASMIKVGFDKSKWQAVAQEGRWWDVATVPNHQASEWTFHGHPQPATDPLQVAVARLLGYRWPAETDADMELADEARQWIAHTDKLAAHADDDGIVCLPAVRGEKPAHERLLALLIDAWETVTPGSWKASTLDRLLLDADCAGKSLEVWLREKFFEQHAKRFQHRPFIWHVWDGLKDGFGALVNYHKLDARNLERLIHTYLGDWLRIQEAGVASGLDGAPQRLAAAQALKKKLEAILEGEAPYDIFVRWKPLAEQPIGWNPDLNDGVRLNIRPWMTAGVLRHNKKPKLNIAWDKDRGKDVESAPWFHKFNGDRINDHHLTLAQKRAARATAT
ncbi:restriction endonuclease subunit M [Azoarcus olearius]|uniref:DNA methyltransferase n=1 Tax=Azoarcus sp. (strain BH72) TaxID=418699 RepID=UPI0008062EF2|nr:DNA methyltransferase [Azoarcus olearius]ANQ84135.1 restriction endonuclease subunit M [Azoarcus olearius]